MRHLRKATAAFALSACALAIAASPALAHEFAASHIGRTGGKGVGEQKFKLGPFNITCTQTKVSGDIPENPSNTLFSSLHYKGCTTAASIGHEPITLKTTFRTPLDVEYHANGFVEVGSEAEEVEGQVRLSGGEVEIFVSTVKCIITWEEQTIPGKAVKKPEGEYSAAQFHSEGFPAKKKKKFPPNGEQQKLFILNEFHKIHFEYSEGQCEEFAKPEEEIHNGAYHGEIEEEMKSGNLEYR